MRTITAREVRKLRQSVRSGPSIGGVPSTDPRRIVSTERGATYGEVFAVREFRVLFGSFALLVAGDSIKMLALSVLVYAQTGSPGRRSSSARAIGVISATMSSGPVRATLVRS